MKKSKQWVYRCDYCYRVVLSESYMTSHEKTCKMNPDRVCRVGETIAKKNSMVIK